MTHRIMVALIVALLATASLAMTATAVPDPGGTAPLPNVSKEQAKADAQAKKDAAEAEKVWRKCSAKGTCPPPVVVLSWALGGFEPTESFCVARVSVRWFTPGSYTILVTGTSATWPISVGKGGMGDATLYDPVTEEGFGFSEGQVYTVTVNGIESAPSMVSC